MSNKRPVRAKLKDRIQRKEESRSDQSLELETDVGNVTTFAPPPFSLQANSQASIESEKQAAPQTTGLAPLHAVENSALPVQLTQEEEGEEITEKLDNEVKQLAFAGTADDSEDENKPDANFGNIQSSPDSTAQRDGALLQTKTISSSSTPTIQRVEGEGGGEERTGWLFEKLSGWASEINGYDLLCVVVGRDLITNEPVERTPTSLVREFMIMIGQEEKFDQLQQSGGIQSAFDWVENELQARDLTWERVSTDFAEILDQMSVWEPVASYERLMGPLGQLIDDVLGFAGEVGQKVMEFVFEGIMGGGAGQVLEVLQRAGETFSNILEDPVTFFSNLATAVGDGLEGFGNNIREHLVNGLLEWVTGVVGGAGITLPETWDLRGIIGFIMQVLGLTWDNLRGKLVERVGEENVARAETTVDAVSRLVTEGPLGLWEYVQGQASAIREQVMEGIKELVITRVVQAGVAHLISMFTPVGALIQAIRSIYTTVTFLLDNLQRISAFVNSILDSISNIAEGVLGPAAEYIENALAGAIPMALDFMLRLLGLGNIGNSIQNTIEGVREPVDNAVDSGLDWVETRIQNSIGSRGSNPQTEEGQAGDNAPEQDEQIGDGEIGETIHFEADGHAHRLWFEVQGDDVELMVASTPTPLGSKLRDWTNRLESIENTEHKAEAQRLLPRAIQLSITAEESGELTLTRKEELQEWLNNLPERNEEEFDRREEAINTIDDQVEGVQAQIVRLLERLFILFRETGDENDRMPQYMSNVDGFTAHHIFPHSLRSMDILTGININDPGNMVYLPNREETDPSRTAHPIRGNDLVEGEQFQTVFHGNYNKIVKKHLEDIEELADMRDWDDDQIRSAVLNLQNKLKTVLETRGIDRVNELQAVNLN